MAVVIVSYEVSDELSRCLRSLRRAGFANAPHEVVVVDNASTDGTAERVRLEHPWVRLVARPDNRGFAASVNEGVALTRAEHVLVLNPDTEVPPDCLSLLALARQRSPEAGAIGFRHVDGDGLFQLSIGLWPSFATELLRRMVQRRLDAGDRSLRAACELFLRRTRPVAWASGSALLVRRDAFGAIGGFDEGYFLYFEDLDLCLRLWRAGLPVVYEPAMTVVHYRGRSARRAPARVAQAYRESQLRFWRTHKGPLQAGLLAAYLRLKGKTGRN